VTIFEKYPLPQTTLKKVNIPAVYIATLLTLLILHKWIVGLVSLGKNSGLENN
jgi:hypothetical protein